MRIIREVRNVMDGRYTVADERKQPEKHSAKPATAGGASAGFREEESAVVRRLKELGLAIPKRNDGK